MALPDELLGRRPSLADYAGRTIGIGLRPEHLHIAGGNGNGRATIPGAVTVVELLGPEIFAHIEVQATAVDSDLVREGAAVDPDEAVAGLNLHGATTLVGRFPPETRVRPGDRVDVAVDLSRLHLFDLDTGAALA
jgi:multiple sugar transport system ATP-binding protein